MTKVVGVTAEHQQNLMDSQVVRCRIVGGDLVTDLGDGTVITIGNVQGDTGATGPTGDVGPTAPARAVYFKTGISITLAADVVGSATVTYPPGMFSSTPNVHVTVITSNITTRGSSKTSGVYGIGIPISSKDGCEFSAVSKSAGTFSFSLVAMAVG